MGNFSRSGVNPVQPMGLGNEVAGGNNFGFGGFGQAPGATIQQAQPQNPNFGFGGFGQGAPLQNMNMDMGALGSLFSALFQGQGQQNPLGALFGQANNMNPISMMPGPEAAPQRPDARQILESLFSQRGSLFGNPRLF